MPYDKWVKCEMPVTCLHKGCTSTECEYRTWDSSDGAYTDYQYRCANGHTWWVEGPDY